MAANYCCKIVEKKQIRTRIHALSIKRRERKKKVVVLRPTHATTTATTIPASKKLDLNTSHLTDSYITFTLKLESGQNFCCNRSIRSSTYGKKNIFEIPPCGSHFLLIHFT